MPRLYFYLNEGCCRQFLPVASALRTLPSSRDVEIHRDGYGIPHVYGRDVPTVVRAFTDT
jgi:acyl-homoserine lactone acylase PvdQ